MFMKVSFPIALSWTYSPWNSPLPSYKSMIKTNNSIFFLADSAKHRAQAGEILRIGNHNIPSRVFTFSELVDATNSFSLENMLGEGGFGRVYRGYIRDTMEVNKHFFSTSTLLRSTKLRHEETIVNTLVTCSC